jgi:hypothetical protein
VKIDPAMSDGTIMGSTTDRMVLPGLAPRSADASSRESGSRSKPAYNGSTM